MLPAAPVETINSPSVRSCLLCCCPGRLPPAPLPACLPQDRSRFVESYQIAERDLRSVVAKYGRKPAPGQQDGSCGMM